MKGAKFIIKKELNRVFSDKKLVFSLFFLPVILMIGMYSLIGNLAGKVAKEAEVYIPSVTIKAAPNGIKDLISANGYKGEITYIDENEDTTKIKEQIKNTEHDLLVEFDADFKDRILNYKDGDEIPEVRTYFNPSEENSYNARDNFIALVLNPMKQMYLQERIGNLDQVTVFNIDTDYEKSQLVDTEKASGKALGMILPYLITMLLFAGVMSVGLDAITGEKERGTLASMLVSPVKRIEIVFGKIVSIAVLSSISAVIYAVALIVSLPKVMGKLSEGMTITITPLQVLQMIIIMLSLVFLYVSLVSIVAVFARTMKEASTYVSPLYILVIVAGMITMFSGKKTPSIGMFAIPVYGNALCIQNIMEGDLLMSQFLCSVLGTVLLASLLVVVIVKAFNSEKVMFNA